jgi:hypothetical protein
MLVLDLTASLPDCSWSDSISSCGLPNPAVLTSLPMVQTVCAKKLNCYLWWAWSGWISAVPVGLTMLMSDLTVHICTCGTDCLHLIWVYLYLWDWLRAPGFTESAPVGLCLCARSDCMCLWNWLIAPNLTVCVPVRLTNCTWSVHLYPWYWQLVLDLSISVPVRLTMYLHPIWVYLYLWDWLLMPDMTVSVPVMLTTCS